MEIVRTFVYLRGLITCDGRCDGVLNRKIGEGRGIFKSLCQIWSHASISQQRKIEIFNACVASKFLYSLESLWMLKADRSRVDSFQCRRLRRIVKIPPSFVSRISNEEVFAQTCQKRFSCILRVRQVRLYQKVQSMPLSSPVRRLVCDSVGSPVNWAYNRKRGRPRQRWSASVHNLLTT